MGKIFAKTPPTLLGSEGPHQYLLDIICIEDIVSLQYIYRIIIIRFKSRDSIQVNYLIQGNIIAVQCFNRNLERRPHDTYIETGIFIMKLPHFNNLRK